MLHLQTYFFKLIHIIFAYDYGFGTYQSRKLKIRTKICTVVYGLIINLALLVVILIKINPIQAFIYFLYIVHHLAHVLILIYFDKDTFCKFLKDLEVIDILLEINSESYGMGFKIAFSLILCLVYKLIVTIIYCTNSNKYCLKPLVLQILCITTLQAHDIPLVVTFFYISRSIFSIEENYKFN